MMMAIAIFPATDSKKTCNAEPRVAFGTGQFMLGENWESPPSRTPASVARNRSVCTEPHTNSGMMGNGMIFRIAASC